MNERITSLLRILLLLSTAFLALGCARYARGPSGSVVEDCVEESYVDEYGDEVTEEDCEEYEE